MDGEAPANDGDVILRANIVGTLVFVVTAVVAAAVFSTPVLWVAAITAMVLFIGGIATFLWSFWNAVQRSRGEQIAVTQLYMLAGGVAPTPIRRLMIGLLAAQAATGLVTALVRPDQADGSPGTSLALGVLVPVFGLGMNGLWAAFHGTYRERTDLGGTTSTTAIDKNEQHG